MFRKGKKGIVFYEKTFVFVFLSLLYIFNYSSCGTATTIIDLRIPKLFVGDYEAMQFDEKIFDLYITDTNVFMNNKPLGVSVVETDYSSFEGEAIYSTEMFLSSVEGKERLTLSIPGKHRRRYVTIFKENGKFYLRDGNGGATTDNLHADDGDLYELIKVDMKEKKSQGT